MSNHEPKPKRSKKITTWFQRTNVSSSSSNVISNPSITSPNFDEQPQPLESPVVNSQPLEPPNNINALERDPGLRCPIWKYPVNERDSVRKAYILLGPFQPEISFPFTNHGGQQRRFQSSWFKDNPWLEYSIALDKAYCFPCFLFDTEDSHHHAFTVDGFKTWKRVCTARAEEIANLVASGVLQTGTGANQICTLQRAGATRWSSHFRSIKALIELFSATKTTLDDMIDQAPREVQRQAKAVLKAMRSFDFVFCLLLMHKVMKITEVLCQTLQRKSLDFVHAMNFVGLTKSLLQEMREKGWNDLVRDVESFCEKHDIDMPDMNACYKDGTGRRCQQRDFITVEHHYHVDVFNALVDFQLSELNRRFSDQASELLILGSTLDPRDNFRNFKIEDICNLAKKFYPEDFDDGEMFALELECAYYEKDMRSDPKIQNLGSISDLCRTLVQTRKSEFFPMLHRLICLILIIPVSTATTERAFSAMNIVKSKLRNKMEDEFLGDCMVLHIEKDYAESITNDEVIKEFETSCTRRVRFS